MVKLEQETAPAWAEKTAFEIAKLLNLPVARYELAQYTNKTGNIFPAVISPDFRKPNIRYLSGDNFLSNYYGSYSYSVEICFDVLNKNNVELPENYVAPKNIANSTDLFVGYLILDYLISNNDRHSGNWEIGISDRGTKFLAPIFDNGAGFGTDTFDIIQERSLSPKQYLCQSISMFGITIEEAFNTAKSFRPQAAKAWTEQLAQIKSSHIEEIFDRVPSERINPVAKTYALELININRNNILGIENKKSATKLKNIKQFNEKDSEEHFF